MPIDAARGDPSHLIVLLLRLFTVAAKLSICTLYKKTSTGKMACLGLAGVDRAGQLAGM